MNGPVIFQNLFDGGAIAEPKELGAPKKFAVLADSPTPTASFTDK
jgi:hypothetical protein